MKKRVILVLLAFFLTVNQTHANLLANGDFESGRVKGWFGNGSPDGWFKWGDNGWHHSDSGYMIITAPRFGGMIPAWSS